MTVAPTPVHGHRAPPRTGVLLIALAGVALAAAVVFLVVRYGTGGSSSSSGIEGSGNAASQIRTIGPFTGVELAGSNNVIVSVGLRRSVVVHADDNLIGRVTTRVQAGRLVIGNTAGSFTTRSPMYVVVTVPSVDALTLSGSGNIAVSGVKAAHLTVSMPGSGILRASGRTTQLDIELPGSGDVQLQRLAAKNAHASVSGSGRIVLTATERLDATVSGSGVIVYGGDPQHVLTSVTGSGAITRG